MRLKWLIAAFVCATYSTSATGQTSVSITSDSDRNQSDGTNSVQIGIEGASNFEILAQKIATTASVSESTNSDLSHWDAGLSLTSTLHRGDRSETFAQVGLHITRFPNVGLELETGYALLGLKMRYATASSASVSVRLEEDRSSLDNQNHRIASLDFGASQPFGKAIVSGGGNLSQASYQNGEEDFHTSLHGRIAYGIGHDTVAFDASVDETLRNLYVAGRHTRQRVEDLSAKLSYSWQASDKVNVTSYIDWSDQIGENFSQITHGFGLQVTSSF